MQDYITRFISIPPGGIARLHFGVELNFLQRYDLQLGFDTPWEELKDGLI